MTLSFYKIKIAHTHIHTYIYIYIYIYIIKNIGYLPLVANILRRERRVYLSSNNGKGLKLGAKLILRRQSRGQPQTNRRLFIASSRQQTSEVKV